MQQSLVHPTSQFLLDRLEFRPHAVATGLPLEQEVAPSAMAADESQIFFRASPESFAAKCVFR
jgi:hypothetical protein